MTIPHYKIVEIGGKNLVVFYPQFKDDEGYKIIDLENRFPIELKNEEEYKMFLEAIIASEDAIKDGLKTLADLVDEMSLLAKGPKGDTRYMWVKYADDEHGNGMSDDPTGKKYIGFAFNKDIETPSDDPSDYKWVKYVADYEGLEIGGRNLLRDSNKGWKSNKYKVLDERLEEDWVVGETYTILIKGEVNEGQVFRVFQDRGIQTLGFMVYDKDNDLWVLTNEVKEFRDGDTNRITVYNHSREGAKESEIEWIKVVKGNKTSLDWSPAPEDIFARIDNVDKAHVGLGNVQNYGIASQSQAENGTSNNAYMTPLRTKQAIEKLSPNYVIDTEIGDDYILKKFSDGTFELKGHVKRTESLTSEINNMYRTGNLYEEFTPIMDDSYKLIYSNAWIMNGYTNTFLVMTSVGNPLSDKRIRYRIMGNNVSPTEDVEFIIGYEVYGTWS